MRRSIITAVIALALAGMLAAPGAAAQATSPDAVLAKAKETYTQRGPREALPEYERALALYRENHDRRGEAITLGLIGNCYKRLGEFPRALDLLNQALVIKREIKDRLEEGKTLSNLGLVYWEMGDYPPAIEHLTRSITIAREIPDQKLEGAALNNLSLVYDEQGDYRRSLEQYQRALELHRSTKFEQGESDTLGNIGGVYMTLGKFREAMGYYQKALVISERLQSKASQSQDLGNIALCSLGLGDLPSALATFERAVALAREAGLKREEADWRRGKGSVLLQMGKYDLALEEYRRARLAYEQAGMKKQLAEEAGDEGTLYLRLGDVVSAEREFRRAVELSRAIGHARDVTINLQALGDVEWRRQRNEEAAALYREAFERAREAGERDLMASSLFGWALVLRDQGRLEEARAKAQESVDISHALGAALLEAQGLYGMGEVARRAGKPADAVPHYRAGEQIAQDAGDPELRWQLAYGRGQALEALGSDEEALAAYKLAVSIIEDVRSQLREERFRAGYIEDKHQVYVALVRLLLKQGKTGQAFLYSEKLRARGYLDLLNRDPSPVASVRERELRLRIRQLQESIEKEGARPGPQQRGDAVQIFTQELAATQREYQNLLDDLRAAQPAYVALRTASVPSDADIQAKLPPDAALLEYVVSDDTLAIFVLTHASLRATTVPVRAADLRAKVELFRDLVVGERTEAWRKPAESLRRLLIEPVEQAGWLTGITHLYVVPHGVLNYLPFAALPQGRAQGARFLVEDYVLAYLPAATTLFYQQPGKGNGQGLLALAPARSRLRFAAQEADTVRRLFPQGSVALLGGKATESAFKEVAGRYGIVHFATHGYFNKANPIFSGVQLEADQQNDGRLDVHEILGLRLDASLVTLSACDTALGSGYFSEVPAGDEFVGLTRAFLFAGSSSVVASLWEVDDRSTLQFMGSFYRRLRPAGGADALAQAQRETLRPGGRYRHPYFWGPFVLAGAMK